MVARSVVPFTSRLNSTKPVAMLATKWRTDSGKAVFSATPSASTSVTAPRRPPQVMARLYAGEIGSHRFMRVSAGSIRNSTASRAASAAMSARARYPASAQLAPARRCGTRTAASRNTMAPASVAACSHTCCRWLQLRGFRRVRPKALITSPAQTTATTPETPSASSANKYSGYGSAIVSAVSAEAMPRICGSNAVSRRPATAPSTTPPPKEITNVVKPPIQSGPPLPVSIATNTPASAMAAASFNRLSPSIKRINLPGAPTSRNTPTTAEGSVVATMAPSNRQAMNPCGTNGASTAPMANVVTNTATTASNKMGAASCAMRRTSTLSATWNSNGGRKMAR